jgi:predicted dehydrogenase
MSDDAFRLATIETGNIARFHRRAMSELKAKGLGDFVVMALCEVNQENAQAAARDVEERFGIQPAINADYQELRSQEEIDGVDLCLPLGLHHIVAIDCMEPGVPVLSEKPLGITVRAARRIAETAERTGCVLSTGHQSRRRPSQRAVHWVLN